MAKFERELHAKASDVIKALAGELVSELPELELIDSSTYSAGQVSIYLFVYRGQSSHFEMTLLVIGDADSSCTVAAITSGGEYDLTAPLERLTDRFG